MSFFDSIFKSRRKNAASMQTDPHTSKAIDVLRQKVLAVVEQKRGGSLSTQDRLVIEATPLTGLERLCEAFSASDITAGQTRHLEKTDVIGKRVADVIVSIPDKPVTMSDQSYSPGFLRLDSGNIINLGSYAPPLIAVEESETQKIIRDGNYEATFRPAIGQTITEILFPDETDDGSIHIKTANGFLITFSASCFWIRPCIEHQA